MIFILISVQIADIPDEGWKYDLLMLLSLYPGILHISGKVFISMCIAHTRMTEIKGSERKKEKLIFIVRNQQREEERTCY